jgi:hypothetical protein
MAAADTPEGPRQVRDPSLADAIIPLMTLVALIFSLPRPVVVARRLRSDRR